MRCAEFLESLKAEYQTVGVLSDKNGGKVLRLRHTGLERDMICKCYETPVAAYDMLKNIRHSNMPEIYDSIHLEDGQIVLEEYIRGMSVAQVLECGKYTYHGACQVLKGICAAVHTLHSYGIIHRDIKPENVMITDSGVVKLIDLNAARQIVPDRTHDTVILGTIGYAPPEQLGISQSDERTDIYALGVLLNVMLTGEHPSRCLAKGRAGKIVQRCTLIDPDSRFPTVEKLLQVL